MGDGDFCFPDGGQGLPAAPPSSSSVDEEEALEGKAHDGVIFDDLLTDLCQSQGWPVPVAAAAAAGRVGRSARLLSLPPALLYAGTAAGDGASDGNEGDSEGVFQGQIYLDQWTFEAARRRSRWLDCSAPPRLPPLKSRSTFNGAGCRGGGRRNEEKEMSMHDEGVWSGTTTRDESRGQGEGNVPRKCLDLTAHATAVKARHEGTSQEDLLRGPTALSPFSMFLGTVRRSLRRPFVRPQTATKENRPVFLWSILSR